MFIDKCIRDVTNKLIKMGEDKDLSPLITVHGGREMVQLRTADLSSPSYDEHR